MKKYSLHILVSLLLPIFLLTGCSGSKNNAVKTIAADKSENQPITYIMSGKIKAEESADITSKISAKVLSINVDVGSVVNKGDCLIKLDSKDLEAAAAQQQSAVNIAKANLNKIKSGARPEQIAQAQAQFDSAKANYENIKNTYEINEEIFEAGGLPKIQLDQSKTALAAAEAAYKSAESTLSMLNNGETADTIAVYEAQLKGAMAGLNTAEVLLQNGTVTSPISGVVTAKNINNGELAAAGVPLLTVVNLNSLIINAYIPSTLANEIYTNQQVSIKVSEISGKEFTGVISVISSAVDSKNKNILVKVKINEADSMLKPGMFAEIGIKEQVK